MILKITITPEIGADSPQEPIPEMGVPTHQTRPSKMVEVYYCKVVSVRESRHSMGFSRTYDLEQIAMKEESQALYLVASAGRDDATFSDAKLCRRFKSGGTTSAIVESVEVVNQFPGISFYR